MEEARRMESLWASFCFEDGVIESWFYGFIEISNCIDFQLFVFCLYLFMSCSMAQCIPSIPIHSINCSSGSSLASMCITCPSSFACIDFVYHLQYYLSLQFFLVLFSSDRDSRDRSCLLLMKARHCRGAFY